MLVRISDKFKETWVNPDRIETIEIYSLVSGCQIYINMPNENSTLHSFDYDTYEEAVKDMDELANKINAAQEYGPAMKDKAVMKYEYLSDQPDRGVYRCSHCGFAVLGYDHDCCPGCGKEIERWE